MGWGTQKQKWRFLRLGLMETMRSLSPPFLLPSNGWNHDPPTSQLPQSWQVPTWIPAAQVLSQCTHPPLLHLSTHWNQARATPGNVLVTPLWSQDWQGHTGHWLSGLWLGNAALMCKTGESLPTRDWNSQQPQ